MAHTLAGSSRPSRYADLSLESEAAITARTELAACLQLAALHGLEEGICNHFSAMVPGRDDLYYLERAAQVQLMAMATPRELKPVPHEIVLRANEQTRQGDAESARAHSHSAMRRLAKGHLPHTPP
ncbi:hypothetical protein MO767_18170 [Pseudomonas sp. UYIF39]|uniref:hypothetical protein n=1 Tax=Pseudomonas sp. UYIF39 TaxID=1630747 RepID=UPI00249F6568|nr:hypothetical protein [Pseudomonas sp. UYIF39]MDI3356261.1 hypothetical protein [Pseudomonas sp. UYIF39]